MSVSTKVAPICSNCGEMKQRLPNLTEHQKLPVFVCVKKVGKQKMPCDGYAATIAGSDAKSG